MWHQLYDQKCVGVLASPLWDGGSKIWSCRIATMPVPLKSSKLFGLHMTALLLKWKRPCRMRMWIFNIGIQTYVSRKGSVSLGRLFYTPEWAMLPMDGVLISKGTWVWVNIVQHYCVMVYPHEHLSWYICCEFDGNTILLNQPFIKQNCKSAVCKHLRNRF